MDWQSPASYDFNTNTTPFPATSVQTAGSSLPTITIDWSKVDVFDLVIDGIGIGADILSMVQPGLLIPAEGVAATVEIIGLAESLIDIAQGDTSDLMLDQTTLTTQQLVAVTFSMRGGRVLPFIGIVGNVGSIWMNVGDAITIK